MNEEYCLYLLRKIIFIYFNNHTIYIYFYLFIWILGVFLSFILRPIILPYSIPLYVTVTHITYISFLYLILLFVINHYTLLYFISTHRLNFIIFTTRLKNKEFPNYVETALIYHKILMIVVAIHSKVHSFRL